jgi:CheY-like chemotaxis protein
VLATDGAEALNAMLTQHFDIVFLDTYMPKLSGIDVAKKAISHFGGVANAPVIIGISASALQEHTDACLEAGMRGFLPKPVSMPILQSILLKLCGNDAQETATIESRTNQFALLNQETLDQLAALQDNEFLHRIVSVFESKTTGQVAELQLAIQQNNRAVVQNLAHNLKGAALNLGANRLSNICQQICDMAETAPMASLEMQAGRASQTLKISIEKLHEFANNELEKRNTI